MINYFIDPVFRAPLWGSILMCFCSSVIGVFVFLRKNSLLGEALSHASFPGVILGVLFTSFFFENNLSYTFIAVLIGAFGSCVIGLYCIEKLQKKMGVSSDSALCFVLSVFFGLGLLLASKIQFTNPLIYQKSLVYLYGQLATMSDTHVYLYALFSFLTLVFIFLFYPMIKAIFFDEEFIKSLKIKIMVIERGVFFLLIFAVVIGMRSVGVVLLSGMLIAPAVAARQFTNKLSILFLLSSTIGVVSAIIGVIGSHVFSEYTSLLFPAGPLIVLSASAIAMLSLLFAPQRGAIFRLIRIICFKKNCLQENLLKGIYKDKTLTYLEIKSSHQISFLLLKFILYRLVYQGFLIRDKDKSYHLTKDGIKKAINIIRIHRLWELYLTDYLGVGAEKVHESAEKIEHIITPEIEEELTKLLDDPKLDPHQQPIPERLR